MLTLMGVVFILFGVWIFWLKTDVARASAVGESGGAPVFDGAIFPPLIIAMGVGMVWRSESNIEWIVLGVGLFCGVIFYLILDWLCQPKRGQ